MGVDAGQYTYCCATQTEPCPPNSIITCPEDQRHYQGVCPDGFTCQNGKPVTIKWRDDNNIGQCFADDITKPNLGFATGDVEEGTVNAVFHISHQVQRTSGVTKTTVSGNKYYLVTTGFTTGKYIYYTGTKSGTVCSGLTVGEFYQIDGVAADSITLKNHAGSSTIAVSANEDSTTYGESTCGNFQLWGNSATGIRALDGQENILSSSASYTIASQSCLDPISSISNHWDTKFVSATNDVFLTSKIPLVYTGVNSCKKYRVVLSGKVIVGLWVFCLRNFFFVQSD